MEINLSLLLMNFGLGITMIGALLGVMGIWGENSNTYYGRAFFYFFNLEYYVSMINQKYRTLWGFLFIGIGTSMQICGNFANYIFYFGIEKWMFYLIVIVLIVFIYFVIENLIKWKVKRIVIKKVLRNYYNEYTNPDLEKHKKETLENIYYVVYLGKSKKFEKINETEVLKRASELLKKI